MDCVCRCWAAYFLTILDLTIINVALPAIATDLPGTSLHTLSWALTLYAIVFGAALVPGGKLGDLYGRRRMFTVGTIAFLAGSVVAAIAPNPTCLTVGRVVQALGAAAMTPNSLAVVLPAFAPPKRMAVIGAWGALAGFGAAAGPPLGGLLADADWRLVFWINLPIGIATLLMTRRVVAEVKDDNAGVPPDLIGAALLGAAMIAVTLGLSQGAEWQWDARFAACLVIGSASALLLVRHCRHHPAPIIEPSLMRRWSFRATLVGTVACWAAFCALLVAGTVFLTEAWGYSVLDTGLAMTPGPALSIATAIAARRLAARIGAARVAAFGALCMSIGALWLAVGLEQNSGYVAAFLPTQLLMGAGMGFLPPMLVAITVTGLPPARLSTGIAVYTIFRQVGAAAGVAGWLAMLGRESVHEASSYRAGWSFIALAALVTVGSMLIANQLSKRESNSPNIEQSQLGEPRL